MDLPALPCACANLRRAGRAVTRLYNRELRPQGLEITQFTLLMALDRTGEVSQGELGAVLELDSTTLTRTLALLKKAGWVKAQAGPDRRQKLFSLTAAGRDKFRHAVPGWNRAQQRLRAALGEGSWTRLGRLLAEVVGAARRA